jgi:hypothetical protein
LLAVRSAGALAAKADSCDPVRHGRLLGKHQTARWNGPARQVPRRPDEPAAGPPCFDPAYVERIGEVEIRPLGQYEGVLAEVHSVSGGAVQIDRLQEQLKRLKLVRTADQLAALLQEAGKKELPYSDFLEELLGREL